jgi:hypothetical protein
MKKYYLILIAVCTISFMKACSINFMEASNKARITLRAVTGQSKDVSVPCSKNGKAGMDFLMFNDVSDAFDKMGTAYEINRIVCSGRSYNHNDEIPVTLPATLILNKLLRKPDVILLNFDDQGCHHSRDTRFLNNKVEIDEGKTIEIDNVSYQIHKDHFFGDRFFINANYEVYEKLLKQFNISSQDIIPENSENFRDLNDGFVTPDDNKNPEKVEHKNKSNTFYLVRICIFFLAVFGIFYYKNFYDKKNIH